MTCRLCGETDPAQFGYNPARCRACVSRRAREYRARNRDAANDYQRAYRAKNADAHRAWASDRHLSSYGLTRKQYDALLEAQGGGCAICGRTEPDGKGRFHVDHDHDCCPGKRSCGACVRGLLCFRCNVALGYLQDSPALLQAAADYLSRTLKESR